MNDLLDLKK